MKLVWNIRSILCKELCLFPWRTTNHFTLYGLRKYIIFGSCMSFFEYIVSSKSVKFGFVIFFQMQMTEMTQKWQNKKKKESNLIQKRDEMIEVLLKNLFLFNIKESTHRNTWWINYNLNEFCLKKISKDSKKLKISLDLDTLSTKN